MNPKHSNHNSDQVIATFIANPSLEKVPFALAFLMQENLELRKQLADIRNNFQPKQPPEYITRQETAKIFRCDLSTLHNWVKKGKLKPYGIGNRVYFLRSEVEAAIKPIAA